MNGALMGFDRQAELEGPRLKLRPLLPEDREALHEAASDPQIWAGHPVKNRHERQVFDPYFDFLLGTGEALVVIDKSNSLIIGCSRFYTPPHRPGTIAIGYTFLSRAYWGGAANFEMKSLMFEHAFTVFDEIWLDIGPDNIRSQTATGKLGATLRDEGRYDLGNGKPDDYLCFVVTRQAWERVLAERA